MKHVHKSVLIWFSPAQMFALVSDVPSYPKFLPWCDQARVLEQTEDGMTAEVGISFSGIRQRFTTRNTHEADASVSMALVDGPFSRLEGTWRFLPVGTEDPGAAQACRVELDLHYGFSSQALSLLVGPVFDKIANTLVDAFVKRAEDVYG